MQYLYPCVLTPEAEGGYAVSFGCGSFRTTSMFIVIHELDRIGHTSARHLRHPMPSEEP